MRKTYAVALTIPDNEAFTALETLRRIGVPVGSLRRAEIWALDVADDAPSGLSETIAGIETVFNPNKHELLERADARPAAGEVWIAPLDDTPRTQVGGRTIAGVRGVRRRVAWQLFDSAGRIAEPHVVDRAVETFLCNPAFEKAIR